MFILYITKVVARYTYLISILDDEKAGQPKHALDRSRMWVTLIGYCGRCSQADQLNYCLWFRQCWSDITLHVVNQTIPFPKLFLAHTPHCMCFFVSEPTFADSYSFSISLFSKSVSLFIPIITHVLALLLAEIRVSSPLLPLTET